MADPISVPLSSGQQRLFAAWTAEGQQLEASMSALRARVNIAANAILAGAVEDLSMVNGWNIDASGAVLVATPLVPQSVPKLMEA